MGQWGNGAINSLPHWLIAPLPHCPISEPHHVIAAVDDEHFGRHGAAGGADTLSAPMPGAVIEIRVTPGDRVSKGETLVVLEAMKLLQSLPAPVAGVVAEIYCGSGDTVAGGAPLVRIDPEDKI